MRQMCEEWSVAKWLHDLSAHKLSGLFIIGIDASFDKDDWVRSWQRTSLIWPKC